jgi:hypothetical protein
VQAESGYAGTILEAGECQLVRRDGDEADRCDEQRMPMKQGNAQKRESEQEELNWNAACEHGGCTARVRRSGRPKNGRAIRHITVFGGLLDARGLIESALELGHHGLLLLGRAAPHIVCGGHVRLVALLHLLHDMRMALLSHLLERVGGELRVTRAA